MISGLLCILTGLKLKEWLKKENRCKQLITYCNNSANVKHVTLQPAQSFYYETDKSLLGYIAEFGLKEVMLYYASSLLAN